MVDASQLANIDLSDEVTQILTSIIKTESASSCSDTISSTLPADHEIGNDHLSFSLPSSIERYVSNGRSLKTVSP